MFWLKEGLPLEQLKIVAFSAADTALVAQIFQQSKSDYQRLDRQTVEEVDPDTATDWEAQLSRTVSRHLIHVCKQKLRQSLMNIANDDEKASLAKLFRHLDRLEAQPRGSILDGPEEYDVFVSYAHAQDREVRPFVQKLRQTVPALKVFFDRESILTGEAWIKTISDAVHKAHTFIAVLSPDYSASPVCWDEFQCAKLKEYTTRQAVIRTVRLYSEQNMPPIMGIHNYIDATEGDIRKLNDFAATIGSSIASR